MALKQYRPTTPGQRQLVLIDRSGLNQDEFASRVGVAPEDLTAYLDGTTSPSASLMIRIRRLSDRFVKVKSTRSADSN